MSTPIKRANKMPPEQQAIIDKCLHPTGKFIPFQPEHLDNSIPDRFEEQVRLYPARPAVKTDSQQLTYGELNRAANHVALAVFDEPGSVALLLEHGAPMIVGLLGVLKAGKISVPMDPRYPSRTLTHMLEDSRASVLVTDCPRRDRFNSSGGEPGVIHSSRKPIGRFLHVGVNWTAQGYHPEPSELVAPDQGIHQYRPHLPG